METSTTDQTEVPKKSELKLFLFISIFLFPIASIFLVGGYGFLIWISQMIMGPPSV